MVGCRFVGLVFVFASVACGEGAIDEDDGSGASGAGASGPGGTGSSGQTTGSGAPTPGPSADGFETAWNEDGVAASCDDDEASMIASGVPHLTFGDTRIFVGYRQVGDNQDPFVARFDAGASIYCAYHETQGPDSRALGLTWDGGDVAYVVYTTVGGGSDLEGKGGWLASYAPGAISGGGPKVSVAGRVDVTDGSLATATFIISVKSDNKVNSHRPSGPLTVLTDGTIEFLGESAHKPIDVDGKSAMDCTDYPFSSRYRFSADLTDVVCADCTQCTSTTPCE